MKSKIVMLVVAIITSVLLALLMVNVYLKPEKTAWVDLPAVFNDFEYKKELEKNYIKSTEARKKILDSLQLDLQLISKMYEKTAEKDIPKDVLAKFSLKRENYLMKKEQFAQDDVQMKSEFNTQIYKQLNQYAKDFGKDKGFAVVLGAEGSGTILYGKEENDVTKELTNYINEKYKGKK